MGMMKRYSFEGKVRANACKRQEERKQIRREIFGKPKSKKRIFPPEKINMERFFFFPKYIGTTEINSLSKSALAIYPVLCSLSNFEKDDWFHVLQEDLSKMSGVSCSQVRNGTKQLEKISLLNQQKITVGKVHYYKYKTWFIRRDKYEQMKDSCFIFHTCIIESGIWAKLTPRAKALYLAIRSTAKFDFDAYREIELDMFEPYELADEIKGEFYRNRKWDVCREPIKNLCKLANISNQNIQPVIEQLTSYHLLKRYEDIFIVQLKPIVWENNYL